MKKNKMMRLASALLVCVLLSTSVISGTFAKYVTSDSASDTARVAKWGIEVQASGNLFGTDYLEASGDTITATSTNVSSTVGNIVAPGTKNEEGFQIAISGAPEVAYTITADSNSVDIKDIFLKAGTYGVMVKATGLNAATNLNGYFYLDGGSYKAASGNYVSGDYYELHDLVTLSNDYYPINWEVAETGNAVNIDETKNLTIIASAINAGIINGTHLAQEGSAASYKLTWEWPISANNGADTILGNLQAGVSANAAIVKLDGGSSYIPVVSSDYNLTIAYGLKVTVEQVD